MEREWISAVILTCLLISSVLAVGMAVPVAADSDYTITIAGSVDTPTREVSVFGGKEISAIAKADVGDTVTVEVSAPDSSTSYTTVLINENQKTVDFVDMEGDDSGEYDLGDPRRPGYGTLDPGSYLFAVENSTTGAREKIHPLVIKGFKTEITAPGSATVGDQINVDVTVTRVNDSATNNYVEVVVADDEQNISKTATKDGGQYTASVDTTSLDEGSYQVYATVRGSKEVYGGEEVIYGVSDDQSLSLDSEDSESTTEEEGAGGGGPGGGITDTTETTAQSATTTVGENTTATSVATASQDEGSSAAVETEASTPPAEGSNNPSGDTTSGAEESTPADSTEVITPATSSAVATETQLPGFGVITVILCTLVVIIIVRLRLHYY